MKTTRTIFAGIGAFALIGGLAACGTTLAAVPAAQVTVTAPAITPAPAAPAAAAPSASAPGTTIVINNNPAPVSDPPAAVAYPAGAFLNVQTLANSVASEQDDELAAAPSYDYDSPDSAQISVNLTPIGYDT
jgi:hypothetical protein